MNQKELRILATAILLAGLVIAFAVWSSAGRYQLVSHGDSVFVLDTGSGETWHQFAKSNGGPNSWKKGDSPWND